MIYPYNYALFFPFISLDFIAAIALLFMAMEKINQTQTELNNLMVQINETNFV